MRIVRHVLLLLALVIGLVAPALLTSSASAVDVIKTCSSAEDANTDYCKEVAAQGSNGSNPAVHAIKIIIDVISTIAGAAALIGLIVSGLRIVLANGDSNAVSTARSGIIYSLVGIGVIVFAQLIVIFVLDRIQKS